MVVSKELLTEIKNMCELAYAEGIHVEKYDKQYDFYDWFEVNNENIKTDTID